MRIDRLQLTPQRSNGPAAARWASCLSLLAAALAAHTLPASAQAQSPAPEVHLVWMGGNDCPPCVSWRAFDLPKLKASPEFQRIRYSYVTKAVTAPVPPKFFLPEEVRPYKEILDTAGAGGSGSPQAAVIVNGQVYDYFWGVRSAEQIEAMLRAIRTGEPYPLTRCVRMASQGRRCEVPG